MKRNVKQRITATNFKTFKDFNESIITTSIAMLDRTIVEKMEKAIADMDIDNIKLKSDDFSPETEKVIKEGEDAIRSKMKESITEKRLNTLLTTLISENPKLQRKVFAGTYLVFKTNTIILSNLNAVKDLNGQSKMRVGVKLNEGALVSEAYIVCNMNDMLDMNSNTYNNPFLMYMMHLVYEKYKIDLFDVPVVDVLKESLIKEIELVDETEIVPLLQKFGIDANVYFYQFENIMFSAIFNYLDEILSFGSNSLFFMKRNEDSISIATTIDLNIEGE